MEVPETRGEVEEVRGEELAQRIAGQAVQYSEVRLLDGLDRSKAASVDGTEESSVCRLKGGAAAGMKLLERTHRQGHSLLGHAFASLLSPDDQTQTGDTRSQAHDEDHEDGRQAPKDLVHEFVVFLVDQLVVLGLRRSIEAGFVDSQGHVRSREVFSQRLGQLGSGLDRGAQGWRSSQRKKSWNRKSKTEGPLP